MSRIKIAFIISNLAQGGAEKQFITLINGLNNFAYDITVYLYACQNEPFYKDLELNTSITYRKNRLTNRSSILKILEAIKSIRAFLKSDEYDLVVSTLFMNNFLVRIAAPGFYKNKIIANVRTSIKLYNKWLLLSEKIQIKRSYLVFNSYKTLKDFSNILRPKYHSKLSVIHNGFLIPKSQDKCDQIIFGSLGRFSSEKNILQVVRVFRDLEQTYPDIKLIIQGLYGNQYDEIVKAALSKNLEIRQKNPDTDIFYSSIKIVVIPSLFEGCPNVLFEALLRRKVCIISEGANSDDFIINGVNGLVYDGTDKGLKEAMSSVIKSMPIINENKMIEEGYQYALTNFSIAEMVSNYERLFLSIYEKNKSGIHAKDYSSL
jgi:glycosyltransferase involved in cell wall biosynthesis